MNTPQKGSIWQHRKGGIYTVDRVVTHTETGEWLVIYTSQDGQSWARPLSEFMDGRFTEQERFRRIPEISPIEAILRKQVFG